jgi:hypothetical protein
VYPANIAIMQFVNNATPESNVPYKVKEMLLHACEQRTQPGLGSAIGFLGDMVSGGLLGNDDIDRLSKALPNVLEEYHYGQQTLEVPSRAELPIVRQGVHRLSELLSSRCSNLEKLKAVLEKDPLPEVRFLKEKEMPH